jgi:DNA-binding phage protein
MPDHPCGPAPDDEALALQEALRAVLAPLAQLAVERGLAYAALEGALKQAVVQAAAAAHAQVPAQRSVSRISTATGINRREVTRLLQAGAAPARRARSPASAAFAHWLSDPAYLDASGAPRVLPRLGAAPSFETLAQTVTRDVHPRSLLDELLRLKLATLDDETDAVTLLRAGFVPRGDRLRLFGFLGDNVGDHLRAAVDNLGADGSRHFEQALFADGLSAGSVRHVQGLIGPQWKALLQKLVPVLEQSVRADADLPAADQHRVRIGLYAFDDMPGADGAAPPPTPFKPKRRARQP